MKILQIPDSPWAIGALCEGIRRFNPHIDWTVIYVPPRDIDAHIEEVREAAKDADIIDFQYWNVAWQLLERIPELKEKKLILTHHNEKNLLSHDWSDFDMLIAKTDKSYTILDEHYPGKVCKIYNAIDFADFKWNENYPPEKPAVGYAGRIVPWKGLKEVARACFELGYQLNVMGKFDKPDYWASIPEEHKSNINFDWFECSDEERQYFFNNLSIYVGNSSYNHEVGTLPFLEAMACGAPIVTTPSGMAADLLDDEKDALLVRFWDYVHLKSQIKRAMEDEELRKKLRNSAWQIVKDLTYERMAIKYESIYNYLLFPHTAMASVIIPATYDRILNVNEIVESLNNQSYKNIEIVVAWDELVKNDIKFQSSLPVKQVFTLQEGYNLAMARNLGVIESSGSVLIFCDSRLRPEPDAIAAFMCEALNSTDKIWFFGDKNTGKTNFVENWSAIDRNLLIDSGMFCERINKYGGMSQELRSRFIHQGYSFKFVPEAKSKEMRSSKINAKRRDDIVDMKNLLFKLYSKK